MDKMEKYFRLIKEKSYKLIIIKNDEIKYTGNEDGIIEIINIYENNPDLLKDSIVIDKVVGRAVAMIYDLASINSCYGLIVSEGAKKVLKKADIQVSVDKLVRVIKNKNNTDLCPMEKLTLEIENSRLGYEKIKGFLNKT